MSDDRTAAKATPDKTRSPRRIILNQTLVQLFGLICFMYVIGHYISKECNRPFTIEFLANAVFLLLAYYIAVITHELGHALVGRCLGMRVFRITLGIGRPLFRFKAGTTQIVFGAIPIGGANWLAPNSPKAARIRIWFCVLAGPMANAFVVFALSAGGSNSWVLYDIVDQFSLAGTLVVANLWPLLWSLLPFKASSPLGYQKTDGRMLIGLPFMKDREFQEYLAGLYVLEISEAIDEGSLDRAKEIFQRGLEHYPDSFAINLLRGIIKLQEMDFIGARKAFEDVLSYDEMEIAQKDMIKNNISWTNLYLEREMLDDDVLESIRDVYKRNSKTGWANGTLGAALVKMGKVEEGIGYLLKAYTLNLTDISLAHNAYWLSVAHAHLGDLKEARRYLDEGKKLHSRSYSLSLAESSIAEAEKELEHESD